MQSLPHYQARPNGRKDLLQAGVVILAKPMSAECAFITREW